MDVSKNIKFFAMPGYCLTVLGDFPAGGIFKVFPIGSMLGISPFLVRRNVRMGMGNLGLAWKIRIPAQYDVGGHWFASISPYFLICYTSKIIVIVYRFWAYSFDFDVFCL